MVFTWPPKNSDEMLAFQREYGGDADIAAASGVTKRNVEQLRRAHNLPTVTEEPSPHFKAGNNIGEAEIATLYAGRRYR